MRTIIFRLLPLLILCFTVNYAMFSEDLPTLTNRAKSMYANGQFNDAITLLAKAAAESTDPITQITIANLLTDIGQSEYAGKNYKNAYEAFRLALKFRPTSNTATQTATEMYLKMKREMDVTKLENASNPSAPSPDQASGGTSGNDEAAGPVDLNGVLDQLKQSKIQLAAMETRLDLAQAENQNLQKELTNQVQLIEKMISGPKAEATLSKADKYNLLQIVQLLGEISHRAEAANQQSSNVQPNAQLRATLQDLSNELKRSNDTNQFNPALTIGALVIGALLLLAVIIFIVKLSRLRQIAPPAAYSPNHPAVAIPRAVTPAHNYRQLAKGELGLPEIDPFSISQLLQIPDNLEQVLCGRDHSLVCAKLSRRIARQLGLSEIECVHIFQGALAHDVGYLLFTTQELDAIMVKGKLTTRGMALVQSHAIRGQQYFGNAVLPEYLNNAILCHHERMDGSGYPRALIGAAIPLIARIIGAADTFVALISNRPYRNKLSIPAALAVLEKESPQKYDPDVVKALIEVVSETGLPVS